jgi:hypothetical protein
MVIVRFYFVYVCIYLFICYLLSTYSQDRCGVIYVDHDHDSGILQRNSVGLWKIYDYS